MTASSQRGRISVGVVKLASCDGCQLALLGVGTLLLELGQRFDIVEFAEASSNRSRGPYDVLIVEGSVSTDEQADELRELRTRSGLLVTIGACATSGGIQALRNWAAGPASAPARPADLALIGSVYPRPEDIDSLAAAVPVADVVKVDAELRGCPIDGTQLVELLTALAVGRRPHLPQESVCAECKRRGQVCVVVAHGDPCLGPVTQGGCGAICPAYGRGCYGCFGPREGANVPALSANLAWRGFPSAEIARRFSLFTGWSPAFREVVAENGGPPGFSNGSEPAKAAAGDGVITR